MSAFIKEYDGETKWSPEARQGNRTISDKLLSSQGDIRPIVSLKRVKSFNIYTLYCQLSYIFH